MNILLHICCGPCSIYPLSRLREQHIDVTGFFYNPNIHPYREFRRRLNSLRDFADKSNFKVEIETEYGLTEYLQQIVFHEQERCPLCYAMRLQKTAEYGLKIGADAFSTTLLYSKYQNHKAIIGIGKTIAEKYGIAFYYEDFRKGWQEGIDKSIAMELYRQPYCGCIYSEQERYDKKLQKKLRALSKLKL
jgi:epoxyqueuosine reductase